MTETWWKPMNRYMTHSYPFQLKAAKAALPANVTQLEMETLDLPQVAAPHATTSRRAPWRPARSHRGANAWRVTLFISNLAHDGGAEVQSTDLARGLKGRGWDVSVVSMLSPKSGVDLLRSEGINI